MWVEDKIRWNHLLVGRRASMSTINSINLSQNAMWSFETSPDSGTSSNTWRYEWTKFFKNVRKNWARCSSISSIFLSFFWIPRQYLRSFSLDFNLSSRSDLWRETQLDTGVGNKSGIPGIVIAIWDSFKKSGIFYQELFSESGIWDLVFILIMENPRSPRK